jgi:hypothetical protein
MQTIDKTLLGRRQFIGGLGAGAAIAATSPLALEAKADDEKRKSRYKESDHVKVYYRVNRYPS